MSGWFLGIDPGLVVTAWAYVRPGGHRSGTIQSKKGGVARLQEIWNELEGILLEPVDVSLPLDSPDLVAIEGYSFASRFQAHQLGELGGVLRLSMFRARVDFVDVSPSQLKKFTTGSSKSKKDEMRLAVYKTWGVELPTEHEIDAFALAQFARALRCEVPLKGYQKEVLDQWRKKNVVRRSCPRDRSERSCGTMPTSSTQG